MKLGRLFLLILFLISCGDNDSNAQFDVDIEPAFPNLTFSRPVDLQHPGDGSDRIFVVEQRGVIKVFENSAAVSSVEIFLDIQDLVNDVGNEEGLLGLAFHPNYESNGYFYVNYTANPPRRTVIARYRVSAADPNQADRNSAFVLLEFAQPFENHNGGQLAFGPDGYLYIATGDGGSAGDPFGNGQSRETLLGKILRIDVDNPSGGRNYGIPSDNPFANNTSGFKEEIYAYGLRNPWRFSFDPVTQWLWAADVGQGRIEEVDIIESGKNYGWDIMEGSACFEPASGCNMTGLVKPIWEYDHGLGRSITGGHVYRGARVPELVGAYIYADFITGRIWALRYDGVTPAQNQQLKDTNLGISSFGLDKNNELYLCAFDGKIYHFLRRTTSVGANLSQPTSYHLGQNFPNPFFSEAKAAGPGNSATTITYTLSKDAEVELSVYNLSGQFIRHLVNQHQPAGEHAVVWNGSDSEGTLQPSGAYFYRLKIGNELVETKRMMLVR
jgi:glucose/arabinose dehydrogenase